MKKLFCMIALGAISFGTVMAAVPVSHNSTVKQDSVKKKIKRRPNGRMKIKTKAKKDTV